jgi:hypothetical protein
VASDGHWYPPELHPARSDPAPSAPPAGAPYAATAEGPGDPLPHFAGPANPSVPVAPVFEQYRDPAAERHYEAPERHGTGWRSETIGRARAPFDRRPAVSALLAVVVVVCTLAPWYHLQFSTADGLTVSRLVTLYNRHYRGWYLAVPLLALLTAVIGGLSAWRRTGERGSASLWVVLRLCAAATVAVVVTTLFVSTPGAHPTLGSAIAVTARWPAYVALGSSVAAFLVTLTRAVTG